MIENLNIVGELSYMNDEMLLPVHLGTKISLDYKATLELYEKRNYKYQDYSFPEFIKEFMNQSGLEGITPLIEKGLGRSTFIDLYLEEKEEENNDLYQK